LLPVFSPRSSGVFVILILWWIIRHKRWRVLGGFIVLLLSLLALSFFVLPNWLVPSIQGLLSHSVFSIGFSSLSLLALWSPGVGSRLSWLLAGALLLLLLGEWGIAQEKSHRRFIWAVSLTIAVTPLLGIPVHPADHVLLILPLMQVLAIVAERWPQRGLRSAGIVLGSVFVVTWLLPLLLSLNGVWFALVDTLVLLLPCLLVIGLYWMRWWIIRSPAAARGNLE
jgi:hypothetical protein